jgi:O-antigen ligase
MNRLKKLLEYGIYALVFLLPWQTKLILRPGFLNGGDWEYGTISLYGTDILLAVLLILFFILSWRNKRQAAGQAAVETASASAARPTRNFEKGIIIILSGLDLFVFLSIFFAPDTILAIYRYILFLLGLGFFWLIIKIDYDRVKLAIAFFSSLLIQAALAIGQFLLQGTFAFKWLGLAAHLPSDLGASVIETSGAGGMPERWLRAYGSLDHPNVLGGVLAVGLMILVGIYLNGYFEKNEIKREKRKEKSLYIFYFVCIVLFAALLFTFSRTAALALAAGMIIFFIVILAKKDRPALQRIGLVALLAAIMFGAIFINYQNLFITRVQATARLEVKSFSERKMYLDDSFGLIKHDWLFGSGIGNYTKVLALKDPHRAWYDLQPVNNVFLLAWAETGIFGLLFMAALLVYLFIAAGKKKNILSLSILLILAIIMMFDHYFWSLPFGILFFWGSIGIVYKILNKI